MSERKAFLNKIHIKNFLSLRNVALPFKPLTVLVGPNASGKSNVLRALSLFMEMINAEKLPRTEILQDSVWVGGANNLIFQLHSKVEETPTVYELEIILETEAITINEGLLIKGAKVFSIHGGQGEVWDENGKNKTLYNARPQKILLGSAGGNGEKPVINRIAEFFKGWMVYDLQPELMKGYSQTPAFGFDPEIETNPYFKFDKHSQLLYDGSNLLPLLSYWHSNTPPLFHKVEEALFASVKLRMDFTNINDQRQLCVFEGSKNPIPIRRVSDGTLRLIAYYVLLIQQIVPPLIAIEEPERNLHPAALKDIANVLEKLSERTQMIITTHSSQLLDAFSPDKLSDSLSVLLLRNRSRIGTELINLEEIKDRREALEGWIADFGIGSAIFDSELLQDIMEEPI